MSKPRGRSVRFRLLAIALLPTLVILPVLLGITIVRWSDRFDATLISKVNADLTIAHQYLSRILEATQDRLQALGASARFEEVVERENGIGKFLESSRESQKLDFLYISDEAGRILFAAPTTTKDHGRRTWPIIASAIAGEPRTEIDLYSNGELALISQSLAERSRLELVPTANAVKTDRTSETRGMVIHSAVPVTISNSRPGVLVGGILLNRNLVFIDTINDLVYQEASLPEGSQGTATLFLEDVRVSTNVRLFEGQRALGTRVSAIVRSTVLDEGKTWLDSAFVVNDWYMSAYEPIIDSFGQRIGMLYVGFLEAPFKEAKYETLWTIVLAFLAITVASIPIFLRWARGIFRPLERMTATIGHVEGGDLSARTGIVDASDEIGRVAAHLDDLLDRIQTRDRQLRNWNEELNERVDERTRELQLANRQLEATTKQLIMSEKLAAIGEITAGVAHEINNPIAVMQGNLDVLRSIMGDKAALATTELKLLDEQIHRINVIVTKLLQFAKPEEYADYVESHKPQDVVSDCLPLVKHLLHKAKIAVRREDAATLQVVMNRTELQQVLVNLMVNAIHAMPDGGSLAVRTFDRDVDKRSGVVIEVADTGVGMAADILQKVFDPFFTTKRDQGTGLGLSITHTLIERQGGTISVDSELGVGTTFSVWLPEAA
ncbi:sensor histidine kinase [Pelagibius sp.]|uniref:sensor histidine kinase n=1 Tax=Pelagibius sp. TaxID=1931238 RepID=UPI003BAFCC47